tara:strand:+ start:772 stop:1419 length:648 start_codon:yes stop_codon:yes gene_type:complete
MLKMKTILKRFFVILTLLLITIIISNVIVIKCAKDKTFNRTSQIPFNKVGLVLGANKYFSNGSINLYYKYRLEAAIKLYKANKISYLLISGDNSTKDYDEPNMFKTDLIKKGIPEAHIFLDQAGFRTLDSVIRAKAIFGQHSITIISQKFHNQRAIYLAKKHHIEAIGFNANDVAKSVGFKTRVREYFAKTKAVIDVIINKQPKFLGDKIAIPHV